MPLPLLVESIIDWYKWYIRWSEVSAEYTQKMYEIYYEEVGGNMSLVINTNTRNTEYNYRTIIIGVCSWVRACDGRLVTRIPLKYVYSSGMNHPTKYNNY